ncbi:MAG: hypothetical protein ACREXK_05770 [Gammaproteobacteria bacterium]
MGIRRSTLFAIHSWLGVKLLILLGAVFPAMHIAPQSAPVR